MESSSAAEQFSARQLKASHQTRNQAEKGLNFSRKKIRPALVERCYKCHSTDAEKTKGGLLLDSRESLLKGGDTGPAVVAGEPEKSRLIQAIRYLDDDLQMPPKEKLSPAQITDFETWVKMGAPYPEKTKAPGDASRITHHASRVTRHASRVTHRCLRPLGLSPA
ncbi:MAG: hypothetical protein FJ403_06640 [Verrucomicrobia bacterium]|nr:hypothetical protein [Verrucomicrobiota bacterium]